MIIHYTHTFVSNSGELKRMKNIDRDVTGILREKTVEVEFYPWRKYKYVKSEGQYTLSDNVVKKYYVPFTSHVSWLIHTVTFIFLMLRYHPAYVIGEMAMFPQYLWIFRKFGKDCKVIFDIHGAAAEEYEYQKADKDFIEYQRRMERDSVLGVDYVICQSDEMRSYLNREYGVDVNKVCVYRCGVDIKHFKLLHDKRVEIRKQLGFKDGEIVFVYSGGLHLWQRVEDAIRLFENYHQYNASSKLLVLTGQLDELSSVIAQLGIDNSDNHIVSTCLPFSTVPDYLNACDIAFLLRHNHAMNAVASPTKLSEYFACGLPVITSKVAQYWVIPEGFEYFIIEDDLDNMDDITNIVNGNNRESISQFASRYLSLEVDEANLKKFLSGIN